MKLKRITLAAVLCTLSAAFGFSGCSNFEEYPYYGDHGNSRFVPKEVRAE